MEQQNDDLHVVASSDALKGRRVDVVVSGSIAAVEAVRFIRSLRRLGAEVSPWLSQGGSSFITPMALTWAAGKETIVGFSGSASHIATGDAVIVAPASSSIIAKVARGMTDSHCTALIASALGQQKPVIIVPAMHDSLLAAPAMQEHLAKIGSWKNVFIQQARLEEGKQKFPEPKILADQVAHLMNRPKRPFKPVLITMGTTRGYIDDVRYISNYSSGSLGTAISEELYRQGFKTCIVSGPCEHKPTTYTELQEVFTTGDMQAACMTAERNGLAGGIFCASVLDYEPTEKSLGKITSGQPNLSVTFKPTPKIIGAVNLDGKPKIGFKLESELSETKLKSIAADYIKKYNLTCLIANELSSVSATKHHAWAIPLNGSKTELNSKTEIAKFIAQLFNAQSTK
jgi:phosphopantothenoylcysteine decarboxylase/phosphopantothenate--cysteine ligase